MCWFCRSLENHLQAGISGSLSKQKDRLRDFTRLKSLVWQQISISLVTWLTLCLVYLQDNSERGRASSLLEKRKRKRKREKKRKRKRKRKKEKVKEKEEEKEEEEKERKKDKKKDKKEEKEKRKRERESSYFDMLLYCF